MSQEGTKEIRPMLRELRKELSSFSGNHYRNIAERSNKSIGSVSGVLNGQWFNKEILNAAIEYRDELRAKTQMEIELVKKKLAS